MRGVEGALSASHASFKPEQEIVFAGWGESTLRWETALVVAENIRISNNNVKVSKLLSIYRAIICGKHFD